MSNFDLFVLIVLIALIVSNIIMWMVLMGLDLLFKQLKKAVLDALEEEKR